MRKRGINMEIEINKDLCINCGACVDNCPTEALRLEGGDLPAFDKELCIYCGTCIANCPMSAIDFKN